MTRVALHCPDLLFASRLEGPLRAAGYEIVRHEAGVECDALVVDLTAVEPASVAGGAAVAIGFYPHVDQDTRQRAEAAGFDVVVPRSRMAREPAAVVEAALAREARVEQVVDPQRPRQDAEADVERDPAPQDGGVERERRR